jgi:hypothetical protein
MDDEQRAGLRTLLRGHDERVIPFAQPGSTTRVYAIASGKGGVGKSSVTANLAVAMARTGLSVGLVDADVYGHSIPRMLNATEPPTMVEGMIMPPQAYGVRVISMLPFKPGGVSQPVAFRGPMLHRALQQFLADVWWGDLDILLRVFPGATVIQTHRDPLQTIPSLCSMNYAPSAMGSDAVDAHQLGRHWCDKFAGSLQRALAVRAQHADQFIDVHYADTASDPVGTVQRIEAAMDPWPAPRDFDTIWTRI